jgi:hypothetical protein
MKKSIPENVADSVNAENTAIIGDVTKAKPKDSIAEEMMNTNVDVNNAFDIHSSSV